MQIATNSAALTEGLDSEQVWDTNRAFAHLERSGLAGSKRTAERQLLAMHWLPSALEEDRLTDEFGHAPNRLVLDWALAEARRRRDRVLFGQLSALPSGKPCLHANDARGARFWIPLPNDGVEAVGTAINALRDHIAKPITLFPHGELLDHVRRIPTINEVTIGLEAYRPVLPPDLLQRTARNTIEASPHLKRLEAESIHILREAVAEAQNPAMLYSIGKDSGVLLHLARKAFFPAPPPFPLLHVDTRWKFREMYLFRDFIARESGMELLIHINPEAIAKDINPFDHGSVLHTDVWETDGLKQALTHYCFDMVFGGARRDEDKSRSKERVFSFCSTQHRWDPKRQQPELWNLYNTRKGANESLRVFPLSNWTELDIWQYIYQENIPVVPLYFARLRPVVIRPEMIMMVDDERCRLLPGERIQMRKVRFRTLGCYPVTSAVDSDAETVEDILFELINTRQSERQGRRADSDSIGSLERKNRKAIFDAG